MQLHAPCATRCAGCAGRSALQSATVTSPTPCRATFPVRHPLAQHQTRGSPSKNSRQAPQGPSHSNSHAPNPLVFPATRAPTQALLGSKAAAHCPVSAAAGTQLPGALSPTCKHRPPGLAAAQASLQLSFAQQLRCCRRRPCCCPHCCRRCCCRDDCHCCCSPP